MDEPGRGGEKVCVGNCDGGTKKRKRAPRQYILRSTTVEAKLSRLVPTPGHNQTRVSQAESAYTSAHCCSTISYASDIYVITICCFKRPCVFAADPDYLFGYHFGLPYFDALYIRSGTSNARPMRQCCCQTRSKIHCAGKREAYPKHSSVRTAQQVQYIS